MVILAKLATEFLERPGLAATTLRSYEFTFMPLLKEYGRWSIDILDRQLLVAYLNQITNISYTTHHRHQAVITALSTSLSSKTTFNLTPSLISNVGSQIGQMENMPRMKIFVILHQSN
jgi:Phage integrase, N-terminal SAM-like domain